MTNLQEKTDIKSIAFIIELLKKAFQDPEISASLKLYIDEYLKNCFTLRMKRSDQLEKLFIALIKAQSEMPLAGKESKSNYGKYADLRSVVESSRAILCKNELCVFHTFDHESDGLYLTATLGHSSGQYITSKIKIAPPRADIHSLGSYITYMKRYTYSAITGIIVGDVDDDGEAAMDTPKSTVNENTKQLANSLPPGECILTPQQLSQIQGIIGPRNEIAYRITKKYGVNTLLQIKQKHFDDIIKGLTLINKTETHTKGATHAE